MEYTVVVEKGERNYSAYVPDLPGCVATAKNMTELERLMREAIRLHIDALREDGEDIPAPTSTSFSVAM